jgi:hypothetical protein
MAHVDSFIQEVAEQSSSFGTPSEDVASVIGFRTERVFIGR